MQQPDIFAQVTSALKQYKKENPEADVVSLSIGDVSCPIVQPIIDAMHEAVDDLSHAETFRGYGGYYGFDFLRDAIIENEYGKYGFSRDEIYVSNGTKTDSTSILELFDIHSRVLVADPMYPIYRDGATALNRRVYSCPVDENFKMIIPQQKYDIIYLCSPSNPIGIALTRDDLKAWIDYCHKYHSVIILDNVYRPFVVSDDVPDSIYELEGSKQVAIELRSFSKQASFTSVRCSYYVIPNQLYPDVNRYWQLRTMNRFNGADYIAQKGALAYYSPQAQQLIKENIEYYHQNSRYIIEHLSALGLEIAGGIDAPFLWVRCPDGLTGWQYFDKLLRNIQVAVVPGEIFGPCGLHHVRLSALGSRQNIMKAVERMELLYEKEH